MNAQVIPMNGPRRAPPAKPAPPPMPLPSSAPVEAALLDGLMSSGTPEEERVAALAVIGPSHLFNPTNQSVLEAIVAIREAGGVADPVAVGEHLRTKPPPTGGWKQYLTVTIPTEGSHADAPPKEYAAILLDLWRKRAAMTAFWEGVQRGNEGVESIVVIGEAQAKLTALAESHAASSGPAAATTYDVVRDVWTDIAAATEHGKPIGVSWGFPVLDERIGLLQQPGYVVIGGRSGQGKTQLAWQTGMNIGHKSRTDPETGMQEGMYYASFEMARKSLLLRSVCIEANVPTKLVLAGKIPRERNPYKDGAECPMCGWETRGDTYHALPTNSRGERVCRACLTKVGSVDEAPCPVPLHSPFERLVAASHLISGTPIFVDDRPCPPRALAERFKRVRDLAAEGKMKTRFKGSRGEDIFYPKCIMRSMVVDSIQDTPPPPGPSNRNRTVEIQDASRGLMNDVAKACGITVLGLAKLTRTLDKQKDRRPTLSDIRECGDIEYQADEIFFVHREQYYLREKTPPEMRNITEIVHGKGRSGLDLESAPARMWFAGGMFFDDPPSGWVAWRAEHGIPEDG